MRRLLRLKLTAYIKVKERCAGSGTKIKQIQYIKVKVLRYKVERTNEENWN